LPRKAIKSYLFRVDSATDGLIRCCVWWNCGKNFKFLIGVLQNRDTNDRI